MMYCSQWFTFEIPDAWWDAAGMRDFKTDRKVYRQSLQSGAAKDSTIIRLIDNIGPDPRSPSVPNFERYRMISMLRAIRFDLARGTREVLVCQAFVRVPSIFGEWSIQVLHCRFMLQL